MHEVEVYASGRLRLKVTYFEKNQKKNNRREGMIDALKFSLARIFLPQKLRIRQFMQIINVDNRPLDDNRFAVFFND